MPTAAEWNDAAFPRLIATDTRRRSEVLLNKISRCRTLEQKGQKRRSFAAAL